MGDLRPPDAIPTGGWHDFLRPKMQARTKQMQDITSRECRILIEFQLTENQYMLDMLVLRILFLGIFWY